MTDEILAVPPPPKPPGRGKELHFPALVYHPRFDGMPRACLWHEPQWDRDGKPQRFLQHFPLTEAEAKLPMNELIAKYPCIIQG